MFPTRKAFRNYALAFSVQDSLCVIVNLVFLVRFLPNMPFGADIRSVYCCCFA